jgi:transcriptional regulator with XRE-family HTH domain
MAADGRPEPAAKRCGEAIARIRTIRGWSRAQLVLRLYNEMSSDDPSYESLSETWLARLENGRMVKIPRQTIEALCTALRCSPQERAWVLLHADRSILCPPDGQIGLVEEALTVVVERLYAEERETLARLLESGSSEPLDEHEIIEATASALQRLITRRRPRQQAAGALQA